MLATPLHAAIAQVCEFEFKFSAVYREPTPSRLPWNEFLLGVCQRSAQTARWGSRVRLLADARCTSCEYVPADLACAMRNAAGRRELTR